MTGILISAAALLVAGVTLGVLTVVGLGIRGEQRDLRRHRRDPLPL